MSIELTVVDNAGELEKYISELDEVVLAKLIDVAKELDLSCLKFINLEGDTVFNEIQAEEICKEVDKLRGSAGIERYILNLIKEAADEARLNVDSYIKFKYMD